MRVLFVCVNYRSAALTRAFADQIRLAGGSGARLVMVDNSPDQPSDLAALAAASPDLLHYHPAPGNPGFLNGLGQGVEAGLARWGAFDWVVLSNVDLKLDAVRLIEELEASVSAVPKVGVVGPAIVSTLTGRDQNPFLRSRPSAAQIRRWIFLYSRPLLGGLYQLASDLWHRHVRRPVPPRDGGAPEPVYAVHGSLTILSAEFVRRVGRIAWPCFLYGEEIWIAERARQVGLQVVHAPTLRVEHHEHATTARLPNRAKMGWHRDSMRWINASFWT